MTSINPADAERLAVVPGLDSVEVKDNRPRLVKRASHPHGTEAPDWHARRFAATHEISDDHDLEVLAPVKESLRREQIYRRALSLADGSSALVITLITAAVWGAAFSWLFLLVIVSAILIAKVQGLYDRDDMVVRKATRSEWREIFRMSALVTIASYLIWWVSTKPSEGRGLHVFAFMLAGMFFLVLPARALARRVARRATADERCLIVGAPGQCAKLANRLDDVPGLDLIGTVSDDDVDCSVAGVHELVEQLKVQRIIAVPHSGWGERGTLKLIQSSKWLGVRVSLMPTVMTVVGASTTIDEVDNMVLFGVPRFGLSRSSMTLKRGFDLVGATAILLLTAPLFLAIALAVKLDSRGSALFRQKRIGREGKPFTMYKFRSMVKNAESLKSQLNGHNETSGLFKMTDDPRVTRVGKFLRRTYLDELPQLINVIRGEMSLVGPRPLIESEDALLKGYDRHRSRLTPGMTGPWQLKGPIDASLPELAKLDYMYASNWSVWADIDILLGTVARVFSRRGH